MDKEVGEEVDKKAQMEIDKEMGEEVDKEAQKGVKEEVDKEVGEEVDQMMFLISSAVAAILPFPW